MSFSHKSELSKIDDKFRIVFDLDETIVHSIGIDEPVPRGLDHFEIPIGYNVLIRPHFYKLLREVVALFDEIYVYTAATDEYAKHVVKHVFHGISLAGLWTRDSCDGDTNTIHKILHDKRSPENRIIDTARTMILDDRAEVSERNIYARRNGNNLPQNHIVIHPFNTDVSDTTLIDVISQIRNWKRHKVTGQ